MLNILKLLLPAMIPAWNFFDIIAPSPRIQYAVLNGKDETHAEWHEFRPRPARVSFLRMLGRMVWNPLWNESLFLTSCAERLIEQPTQHSEDEILKRIYTALRRNADRGLDGKYLRFRLQVLHRAGERLVQERVFESRLMAMSDSTVNGGGHESR